VRLTNTSLFPPQDSSTTVTFTYSLTTSDQPYQASQHLIVSPALLIVYSFVFTIEVNSSTCSIEKGNGTRWSLSRSGGANSPAFTVRTQTDILTREIPNLQTLQQGLDTSSTQYVALKQGIEGWNNVLSYIQNVSQQAQAKTLQKITVDAPLMPLELIEASANRSTDIKMANVRQQLKQTQTNLEKYIDELHQCRSSSGDAADDDYNGGCSSQATKVQNTQTQIKSLQTQLQQNYTAGVNDQSGMNTISFTGGGQLYEFESASASSTSSASSTGTSVNQEFGESSLYKT